MLQNIFTNCDKTVVCSRPQMCMVQTRLRAEVRKKTETKTQL